MLTVSKTVGVFLCLKISCNNDQKRHFYVELGEKLGMKSSKNVYISNKFSVKDYGKPKILISSLLLFYREKSNDFSEI